MPEPLPTLSEAPQGVDPRKWARLEAFLGALPPASAAQLFATLENAAASDDGAAPTAAMLKTLRTRLIDEGAAFPPRRRSAQRCFFEPFEDFFIARRRGRKRRARIARATLAPVWALIREDPACADAAIAAAALDAAIAAGARDLESEEAALFAAAGEGLKRLVAHADDNAGFRADLGARLAPGGADAQAGAAALHDLAELSLLAPLAAQLKAARAAFRRPVGALSPAALAKARRLYASAADEVPDAAGHVLLAIAARMAEPSRALALYYHVAADPDLPYARADAAALVETLFDDLEGQARDLERDADADPDTEDAPARLAHFAAFADGMIEEAARAGDGVVESRVEACRDIAAAALARWCEQGLAAVRKAHPVRHAGGSSRLMALRPNIARPVDRAAGRAAQTAARFLQAADALSERLGRPGAADGFLADALAETRRYAGDLIAEIRAAEGAERLAARQRMEATLAAAAPLLPESELALLADRAAAAAVSA